MDGFCASPSVPLQMEHHNFDPFHQFAIYQFAFDDFLLQAWLQGQ